MEGKSEEWNAKLAGRTLIKKGETTTLSEGESFNEIDLPQGNRVLPPGALQTRDFRPERLNVFVDDNYKIERAYFG